LALDRYRQLGHRFYGKRVVLREGSLTRRWTELDPGGIVSFELRRSPAQRRAGLVTVALHLGEGAGSRRALDAGADQARTLLAQLQPELFVPLVEPAPSPHGRASSSSAGGTQDPACGR
jgi:putative membrane protein